MEAFIEVVDCILADMAEPVAYLPWGIVVGLFAVLFFRLGTGSFKRCLRIFLASVYLTVLLYLTFFSRESGSRNRTDLVLFQTWGDSAQSKAYFIENILLFIPYGLLLPAAAPFLRKGAVCLFSALSVSIGLELLQRMTQRGYCQLDDVLTNVVGAAVGWLALVCMLRVKKHV